MTSRASTRSPSRGSAASGRSSTVSGHDRAPTRLRCPFDGYDGSGLIVPDSGDDTWAKIVLDPAFAGRGAARARAPATTSLARAVVWGSLREALLDSRMSPIDLSRHRGAGTAVRGRPDRRDNHPRLARVTGRAAPLPATSVAAPPAPRRVSPLAATIMEQAAPSSLRQLVAARTLVNTTEDLDMLRVLADGRGARRPAGRRGHALAADPQARREGRATSDGHRCRAPARPLVPRACSPRLPLGQASRRRRAKPRSGRRSGPTTA